MAAIDKLCGTCGQYYMLYHWANKHYPELTLDFYTPDEWVTIPWQGIAPIANFNHRQDRLLLWRCPIKFIRTYLAEQCGLKTRWYHKLFWKF